jgi:hypothetical protein
MVEFDLDCLEMCGKLALEDKENHDGEDASDVEESSETSEDENVEKPTVASKLVSKMESLVVEEKSEINLRPKIIELD